VRKRNINLIINRGGVAKVEQGNEFGGKEGEAYEAVMKAIAKLHEEVTAFDASNSKIPGDDTLYRVARELKAKHDRLEQRLAKSSASLLRRGGVVEKAAMLKPGNEALQVIGEKIEAAISKKLIAALSTVAKSQNAFQGLIMKGIERKFAELSYDYDLSIEGDWPGLGLAADGFKRGFKSGQIFGEGFLNSVKNITEMGEVIFIRIRAQHQVLQGIQKMSALLEGDKFDLLVSDADRDLSGLEEKITAIEGHLSYFRLRIKMIADMSSELDDYFLLREMRFKLIDKLAGGIVKRREEFVGELKALLENYAHSGGSGPVLDKLAEGKAKFSGTHFRTLLNQLTVQILDLERKRRQQALPKDGITPVASIQASSEHSRARNLFHSIPHIKENRRYLKAVTDIYREIILLKRYVEKYIGKDSADGKAIKQLARELREDVDRFVLAKPHEKTKEQAAEAYMAFQEIFTARLHSQDVVMRRHLSVWPVIANIAIGVATLGVALGVKLIHSKSTQDRYSLFFDNAKSLQRRVEKMEKSATHANISEPKSPKSRG
jgi:hypothetical protein